MNRQKNTKKLNFPKRNQRALEVQARVTAIDSSKRSFERCI